MIFLGSQIKNFGFPYVVAEISGNHSGKLDRAYELINQAKIAGADAVKIQAYDADSLTLPTDFKINGESLWNGQNLYELYMRAATPFDWVSKLFEYARSIQIPIFSSVYDMRGLQVLSQAGCRAFKIASFEAIDTNFIQKVVATGKPVIMSTGTLNDIELDRSIKYLDPENSIVLHCVSKYPCELTDISLGEMVDLQKMLDQPVGFSCHTDDPQAVLLAQIMGAAMIELHLTLDDEEAASTAEDYQFSFTPESLKYTVTKMREAVQATAFKLNQDAESRKLRRSLYVIKDIRAGETFTEQNIGSYRPNLGCDPHLLPNIIGRKANQNLARFTPMKMEYIK